MRKAIGTDSWHFDLLQFHRFIPGFMCQGGDLNEFTPRGQPPVFPWVFDVEVS